MLIYLDSVILIYFFDHVGVFQTRAAARIAAILAAGDRFAVCDLTRLECRVDPMKRGDRVRLGLFDAFFARPDVEIVPLTTTVYDRATAIRALHGFKTVDSLHLAAAVEVSCGSFLTNDTRLGRFPDLTVEKLP